MSSKRTVKFQIYRYDPDKDDKPYMQGHLRRTRRVRQEAPGRAGPPEGQGRHLSFRRSCREGVCGSDAMNINGKNGLACLTSVDELAQPITIRPLPGLPVIRDVIVDMTQFFKQYHSIKPYLINNDPAPERERLQSPGRPGRAQRSLRVHPVRLLLHELSVVLVEPGQVRRSGRSAGGLPLPRGYPRPGDQRASRQPGRSVPSVPLPLDHELRRRLPEGPEPDEGDWQDRDMMVRRAV